MIVQHGLLLTVERGALLEEAVRIAAVALPQMGIAHEHVGVTE
jgi:hypothetical protein